MIRAYLLVGLGGAFGSMLRYFLSLSIPRVLTAAYPFATFFINIAGCLAIGLIFGFSQRQQWMQGDAWLILATGFCGGFTTFSAFALDNVNLIGKQQSFVSLLYTLSSVLLGIALCRLGIWIAR